ncbi:hypothetical protein MPTK1_6g02520 [Marchantia polymorpha subsp. ruderalis]|uniref:Plant synaptotagmin n=2 Tax=Marchantia polymorpha TaxID=3197 RepID=A0AAF6BMT2_MARPO|nr:hypothetical protein MARPO_0035s0038 [Marchantia polymorpha]BBN13316.1 hypothetical protein Mp_6g02520 [Marchantia polymorpha subsp. ruderalis]|eukprot:PTQ41243.1 hypothetical protein MARPO_0035s0038 [Marchantia polymorpha]
MWPFKSAVWPWCIMDDINIWSTDEARQWSPAELLEYYRILAVELFVGLAYGMVLGLGFMLALVHWQRQRARQRQEKAIHVAALSQMSLNDLRKLFPQDDIPLWLVIGKYEKVNWINMYLKKIWPLFSKATSIVMKEVWEPFIDQYRPSTITALTFQKFTIGTIAPSIQGLRIAHSTPDEIAMDAECVWQGNPSIILKVRTLMGLTFPIQVKDVSLVMVMRLIFRPLVEELPGFAAFTYSIKKKKRFDFRLKVIGGDIGSFPGLAGTVEETIRATVLDCLMWPMRIPVIILPSPLEGDNARLQQHMYPRRGGANFTHNDLLPAAGILDVKLVQAKDLLNKDLVSKADAFALLYIRPIPARMKRSKTINGDLSPIWNEIYEFEVEEQETQKLTIKVFDEDREHEEELLGCAQVLLRDLEPGVLTEKWINLVRNLEKPNEGKYRGEVNLELLYRPYNQKFPAMWNPEVAPENLASTSVDPISTSDDPAIPPTYDPFPDEENLNFIESLRLNRGPPLNPDFSFKGQMWEVVRGVLSVTVLRGENLISADMNGLSDPFVTLKMRKSRIKKQTKVIYKTLNPEWNQTLDFLVEDAIHDMLHIKVWDHDTFKKDFLGKCATTLTKTIYMGEYNAEFKLDGVSSGKLFLHMKWTPQPFELLNGKRQRRHSSIL